jgi:hypothetical protein
MAIYLLKYNPSEIPPIGATQLKTLAVGNGLGTVNVGDGGWYGGVDDTGVYLLTCDTTTLNLTGRSTGNGTGTAPADAPTIWRTTDRTNASIISLVNRLPGSPGNLSTITDVLDWLDTSDFGLIPVYQGIGDIELFAPLFGFEAQGTVSKNGSTFLTDSGTTTGTILTGDTYSAELSILEFGVTATLTITDQTTSTVIFTGTNSSGGVTSGTYTRQDGQDLLVTMSVIAN